MSTFIITTESDLIAKTTKEYNEDVTQKSATNV